MNSTTVSNKIKNLILYCIGIIIIILIISLIGIIKDNSIIFPSFGTIMSRFFGLFSEGNTYRFIWNTILDFIIVLLCSVIIGFTLGTLAGLNTVVRGILKPLMTMLRSIPVIVLIVIVMLAFPQDSYRHVPIIASTLITIPIIYEAIAEGIINIDKQYIDAYRLCSNLNARVLIKIYYPLISGYIKQAMVNAIGIGIKTIVATEYLSGIRYTLGNAIYNSRINVEYDYVYAYALLMILLVIFIELIPSIIMFIIKCVKNKHLNAINNKENTIK